MMLLLMMMILMLMMLLISTDDDQDHVVNTAYKQHIFLYVCNLMYIAKGIMLQDKVKII